MYSVYYNFNSNTYGTFYLPIIFITLSFIIHFGEFKHYLTEDRIPHWMDGNPNTGPDFSQPEQIHLSYGGLSKLFFFLFLIYFFNWPFLL